MKNKDCSYIARTVFKFIPEIKYSKEFDLIYSLFLLETDKALLRGWKDAKSHEVIIHSLMNK